MKKYLLSFAVMLAGASLLTGCLSDSDDNTEKKYQVPVSRGAFVVCSGNSWSGIDGSLTYYDYITGNVSQKAFSGKNGRVLGNTPNDAIVYGSKMYIVVTGENTIEVVDAKTLASIKQIKTTDLMGEDGVNPRHITCAEGKVFVTTYGSSQAEMDENYTVTGTTGNGYVAAIDTTTLSLTKTYTAGSYPEGITYAGGLLYVCNSDYSACKNASISVIDVNTGSETKLTNPLIKNPTMIGVATADPTNLIFVLDMGNYADVPAQVVSIVGSEAKALFPATFIAFGGTKIYGVNAPYGSTETTYDVYDIFYQTKTTFTTNGVFSPAALGVDPVSGHVFIASYNKGESGYADYSQNGYVQEYDANGAKVGDSFVCGVGPQAICFNAGIETIVVK